MNRRVQYYKNYFMDFYNALDPATQRKIAYVIQYIKYFSFLTMETLSFCSMASKRIHKILPNKKSKKQSN